MNVIGDISQKNVTVSGFYKGNMNLEESKEMNSIEIINKSDKRQRDSDGNSLKNLKKLKKEKKAAKKNKSRIESTAMNDFENL